MYGSYSSSYSSLSGSSSSAAGSLGAFLFIVLLVVAVVNIMAIIKFVEIAKEKDPNVSGGLLWAIGLCTPFVVLPLLVIAMPNRRITNNNQSTALPQASAPQDELPSI